MYKYIYSIKGNVYHRRGCKYVQMINEEYKKEDVAIRLMKIQYCKCKYCSTLVFKFKSEKHLIDKYCEANGLIYRLDDESLLVQSEIATWLIKYDDKSELLILFHGNRCPEDVELRKLPPKDYHRQKSAGTSETLMGFLIYIRDHDDYRNNLAENVENMPKKTKKQRTEYKKVKKKERTYKIAKVLQLLNSMEQKDKDLIKISILGNDLE